MTAAEEDEGPSACMTPVVWFRLSGAAGALDMQPRGVKSRLPLSRQHLHITRLHLAAETIIATLTTSFIRRQLHIFSEFIRKVV